MTERPESQPSGGDEPATFYPEPDYEPGDDVPADEVRGLDDAASEFEALEQSHPDYPADVPLTSRFGRPLDPPGPAMTNAPAPAGDDAAVSNEYNYLHSEFDPTAAATEPYQLPRTELQDYTPETWKNIASLVLSLVGLGLLPLIASVAGIVLGHMGRAAARRGMAKHASLGTAGIVIGWVGLSLWVIGFIWVMVALGSIFGAAESGGF